MTTDKAAEDLKMLPAHITEEDIELIASIVIPVALDVLRKKYVEMNVQLAAYRKAHANIIRADELLFRAAVGNPRIKRLQTGAEVIHRIRLHLDRMASGKKD